MFYSNQWSFVTYNIAMKDYAIYSVALCLKYHFISSKSGNCNTFSNV